MFAVAGGGACAEIRAEIPRDHQGSFGITARLAYAMSSEATARAAAHRLRELGAEVTLPRRRGRGRMLVANVPNDHAANAEQLIRDLDPGAVNVGSR